jgi:beta-lactamase regulating signal transducer with metallopeptidase domain
MPADNALLPFIGDAVRAANGLAEWLVTYALHSTLLIGAILLFTATRTGRAFASRHGSWIWRFALVGAVASSSLQALRSSAPLGGTLRLDRDAQRLTRVRVEVQRTTQTAAPSPEWTSPDGSRHVVKSNIEITPLWPLVTLGVWCALAGLLTAWFFAARARFIRSMGRRRTGLGTLADNALRHLTREHGIEQPVSLTLSDTLASPVALDGREICLPSRALSDLDPIRLESIIAHELAHVVRRDSRWLTIARVIEAVFFFQPLNRIARRRMQEAAEFASDAWASTRVARPIDLAHCLARVAEWTVAAPRVPVPAMAERPGAVLVRRVERLTTGRVVHESPPGRAARLGAVVALAALILLAPRGAIGADRPPLGGRAETGPAAGAMFLIRAIEDDSVRAAPDSVARTMIRDKAGGQRHVLIVKRVPGS